MPDIDLVEIAPSLHRLRIEGGPAYKLNSYLWVGDDGVTLVDTGWPDSAAMIDAALRQLSRRREDVVRVVLTHFHADHAGAAAEIARWGAVEVAAGSADAEFVAGDARGPLPVLTDRELELSPTVGEMTEPSHGPPCRVDRRLADGDVLDFAGGARVIAMPGHTPGSVALHLPAAEAVLTGDALADFEGDVILGVFNTDRARAAQSAQRLAATQAGALGFGHGEAVAAGGAEALRHLTDPFA